MSAWTINCGRGKQRTERIERPLFPALGLSRADAQQKSLGRRAVGADTFFKLPGGTEPPRRTGIPQPSLLAPLSECGEHSHPPNDRKNLIRGVAGWEARQLVLSD